MKKKLLSVAVLAAMGAAGSANAVHVNPDGLGQVLLNPYYTVQNGFDTYVHIVNTTNQTKAVKVRFLEGKNSQEVLDFNLYLSPYDEWTGVIQRTAQGAGLVSADTSCIAPTQLPLPGEAPQEFVNYEYLADSVNGFDRTREGYIEIIEMGNIIDSTLAAGIKHGTKPAVGRATPANCDPIRAAAGNSSHDINNLGLNTVITAPSGGLYGFTSIINVAQGLKTSVDAVAIDHFFDTTSLSKRHLHYLPGDTNPNLSEAGFEADILNGPEIIAADMVERIDAVSAVLMRDSIVNDYAVDAGRGSKTDWVITFPTKRYYVNGGTVVPFSNSWSAATSRSCDEIEIKYWDYEEQEVTVQEGFSPRPPEGAATQLCNEANTLTIRPAGTDSNYETLFGAEFTNASFALANGWDAGWMRISFNRSNMKLTGTDEVDNVVTLHGLPVIGFSAIANTNGSAAVVNGVNTLSNYMSSITHKATRKITITEP